MTRSTTHSRHASTSAVPPRWRPTNRMSTLPRSKPRCCETGSVLRMCPRRSCAWLEQPIFMDLFIRHKKTAEEKAVIQRFLIHDYLAHVSEEDIASRKTMYQWAQVFPLVKASVLFENSDVLVAAAATGRLSVLTSVARWATESLEAVVIPVDVSRIVEVACLTGHVDIAAWLCDANNTHWVDDIRKKESLKIGLTRAVVALKRSKNEAVLIEMRKLPIAFDDDVAQHDPTNTLPQVLTIEAVLSDAAIESASPAVFTVLTTASIMATIGSFQQSIREAVKGLKRLCATAATRLPYLQRRLGALPRMAIIKGDLTLLKSVYIHAQQRASSAAKARYSFENAMHIAAGEGRLSMLQWLHTLPGDDHKCRPDTMALAARSGWADVVEWLHLNCPESGVTMSEPVINDVGRKCFVDVLRVCLQYGLGEFTARSIEVAASAGTLEKLEGLPSLSPATAKRDDETNVMYRAIRCGRAQVIEALRLASSSTTEEQKTDGDHDEWLRKCLQLQNPALSSVSEVVVSRDLQAIDTSEHVTLGRRSITTDELVDVAIKCGRVDLLRFLHEHCGQSLDHHHLALAMLSPTVQQDVMIDYILATVTTTSTSDLLRQCAIDHFADVCDRGSPRGIQLLFRPVVDVVEAIRHDQLPKDALDQRTHAIVNACAAALASGGVETINRYLSGSRRYLIRGLLHCGQLSPAVLSECFHHAVAAKQMKAIHAMLAELSVDQWSDDTLAVFERGGLYEMIPRFNWRTASDMARVLREAPSLDACRKLLATEDTFYPLHVVMENAPVCALRVVVRCLLAAEPSDQTPFLHRAANVVDLRLGVDDLLQLISRSDDDELLRFVVKHKHELIDSRLWMEACSEENLDVLVFLYREVGLINTSYEEQKNEAAAVWALRNAMRIIASKTPPTPDEAGNEAQSIRSGSHSDVVQSLFRQHSKEVQARVIAMLIDAVCGISPPETIVSRFARLVDVIGLDLVQDVPKENQQRVLELALDAERFEAATAMLAQIPVGSDAAAKLKILPLMVKAVRHNHLPIIGTLYALKPASEVIDVAGVRNAFGLADASAAHTLLTELQQLDAGIHDQLEVERSLFGVAMTSGKKPRARGRPSKRA